jgi:hypothetical protein
LRASPDGKTRGDGGATSRSEIYTEALRLLQGPSTEDRDEFVAAYRLTRGILTADFYTIVSYVPEIRSARPYSFRPSSKDEWERFREAANGLGHEWETWSVEVGNKIGVEGSYSLPKILDLSLT